MRTSCYLVVGRNGFIKVTKTTPVLEVGQIHLRVNINIPNSYFDNHMPNISISLPEKENNEEASIQISQKNRTLSLEISEE